MAFDDRKARERFVRIELLIEEYRRSRLRRRMRKAMRESRDARVYEQLERLESRPQRVH